MHQSTVQSEPVAVVPPEIAPSEDLTARGRQVPESVEFVLCGEPQYAALFDRIARVLHRREQGNVMLVGERGVGIGAMLGELARWGSQIPNHKEQITNKFQVPNSNEENGELSAFSGQLSAGSGDGSVDSRPRPGLRGQALRGNDGRRAPCAPPFLRGKRFVEVNCRYTVPEESRIRLLGLLASVARHEELIVCIDGFGSLLRGERGATNKGALLSALANVRCRLIGIMTPREYEELVADDVDMLEHFARVDVPEPDVGTAIKLLRHFSKGLEQKYGIAIEPAAVELAVVLSANYILNEFLPGKALKILSRVCAVARTGGGNGRRWRAARNRGIGLARERRRTRVE